MPDAAAPAKSSDFVKMYVWGMGLVALVFAGAWFVVSRNRDAYRQANADAAQVFGTVRAPDATPPTAERTPTTISSLAVGILKYLQTYKDAKVKPDEGKGIPIQLIKDRASGVGMSLLSTPAEQTNPVRAKGYEEVYATFTFEPTDLERLATFLYNFEVATTKYRVLELRWDLRPDKENPLVPGVSFGNLITKPSVKIGYRRPITSRGG